MVQGIDYERYLKFKKEVENLHLRFPVAEISRKTEFDKGYVSKALKGKKPLTDNFIKVFYSKFTVESVGLISVSEKNIDVNLFEIRAQLDLLTGYMLTLQAATSNLTIEEAKIQYGKDLQKQVDVLKRQ